MNALKQILSEEAAQAQTVGMEFTPPKKKNPKKTEQTKNNNKKTKTNNNLEAVFQSTYGLVWWNQTFRSCKNTALSAATLCLVSVYDVMSN